MLPHLHLLLAIPIWHRLRHLGGVGLVLLGLADNSVVPLTGSMDVLTIWLAARHLEPWPYYALMATLGAVLGGYITYSLARKGGEEAMERKLSKRRATQFRKAFARWGFAAVAVPALLPPPFPFLPFLLAAGAMQYSRKKFLAALTSAALFATSLRLISDSATATTSCVSSPATTNQQSPFSSAWRSSERSCR